MYPPGVPAAATENNKHDPSGGTPKRITGGDDHLKNRSLGTLGSNHVDSKIIVSDNTQKTLKKFTGKNYSIGTEYYNLGKNNSCSKLSTSLQKHTKTLKKPQKS